MLVCVGGGSDAAVTQQRMFAIPFFSVCVVVRCKYPGRIHSGAATDACMAGCGVHNTDIWERTLSACDKSNNSHAHVGLPPPLAKVYVHFYGVDNRRRWVLIKNARPLSRHATL